MVQTYEAVDYWDDEWDDDSESGDRERGGGPPPLPIKQQPSLMPIKSASHHDDISLSKIHYAVLLLSHLMSTSKLLPKFQRP